MTDEGKCIIGGTYGGVIPNYSKKKSSSVAFRPPQPTWTLLERIRAFDLRLNVVEEPLDTAGWPQLLSLLYTA